EAVSTGPNLAFKPLLFKNLCNIPSWRNHRPLQRKTTSFFVAEKRKRVRRVDIEPRCRRLGGVVFSSRRVNHSLNFRDLVCGKTSFTGVLAYQFGVGRNVNTIDLIVGDVAVHPLNLRTEIP